MENHISKFDTKNKLQTLNISKSNKKYFFEMFKYMQYFLIIMKDFLKNTKTRCDTR